MKKVFSDLIIITEKIMFNNNAYKNKSLIDSILLKKIYLKYHPKDETSKNRRKKLRRKIHEDTRCLPLHHHIRRKASVVMRNKRGFSNAPGRRS